MSFSSVLETVVGDPVYVITVRHPLDTAVSWQRFIMPPKLEGDVSFVPMNLLRCSTW